MTERSINIGLFIRRTHNMIVVHHFQTWADAAAFKAALAKLYADEHAGADINEHLAQTLYPLANNVYETTFRLIETALPPVAAAPTKTSDADGLNLDPRPEPSRPRRASSPCTQGRPASP